MKVRVVTQKQDRILRAARNLARMAENARKAQEAAALRLQAKWHLLGADREAIELLQRVTDHWPTQGVIALREEVERYAEWQAAAADPVAVGRGTARGAYAYSWSGV